MRRDRTREIAIGTAALCLGAAMALAEDTLSQGDRTFIEQAAEGGHAEVAMGESAAKSDNPAISAFGKQMIAEATNRKAGAVEVLTPGGLRARIGGLPPGGQESEMLFAVGEAGGEQFTLLLRKSDHGWRVAGLVR